MMLKGKPLSLRTVQDQPRPFHALTPNSEWEPEEGLPEANTELMEKRLFLDKELSQEKRSERLRQKVMDQFTPKMAKNTVSEAAPPRNYPYLKETYDDHVIVEVGPKTFAVPYSISESGEPKLGSPRQVRPAYISCDDSEEEYAETEESDSELEEAWSPAARAAAAASRKRRATNKAAGYRDMEGSKMAGRQAYTQAGGMDRPEGERIRRNQVNDIRHGMYPDYGPRSWEKASYSGAVKRHKLRKEKRGLGAQKHFTPGGRLRRSGPSKGRRPGDGGYD